MEDNRKLVLSRWGLKPELIAKFDYLIGSLASMEQEIASLKGAERERHVLSFGELAMIHNYAQELADMTGDFIKPEGEKDDQTMKRIATTSKTHYQIQDK